MKPLNPADYPTYNVGDKVTIRQWDDMESEFGLDEYGGIKVPKAFTEFMKKILRTNTSHCSCKPLSISKI